MPSLQGTWRGKLGNFTPVYPWGYWAETPEDTLVIGGMLNGNPESRFGFPTNFIDRPTDWKKTEFGMFHGPTGALLKFTEDGAIDITTASGQNVNVTATTLAITGDVTVSGDLTVTGDTALGATVTSNSKDISDTHGHNAGVSLLDSVAGACTGTTGIPV